MNECKPLGSGNEESLSTRLTECGLGGIRFPHVKGFSNRLFSFYVLINTVIMMRWNVPYGF
jgi:hypothetical protein